MGFSEPAGAGWVRCGSILSPADYLRQGYEISTLSGGLCKSGNPQGFFSSYSSTCAIFFMLHEYGI